MTSGATESIKNTAVKGYLEAHRRRGGALRITAGDHPATQARQTGRSKTAPRSSGSLLNPDGTADRTALEAALEHHPVMVSMLSVNKTGAVNDIGVLAALRDRLSPETALHIDHVQAWQRLPLNLKASGIELASFSGTGDRRPQGYRPAVRRAMRWLPWLNGGGQGAAQRHRVPDGAAAPLAAAAAIGHQTGQRTTSACERRFFRKR